MTRLGGTRVARLISYTLLLQELFEIIFGDPNWDVAVLPRWEWVGVV